MILVNIIAGKILYQYRKIEQIINESDCQITVVEPSPLVDIIGVGLTNGTIAFVNIRKDSIIFTMKQKMPVRSMAFSD